MVWVIVDRLTKSANFLAMRMTFILEAFCRLYIRGDCPITWSASLYHIELGSQVYSSFLGRLSAGYGDTIDDEYHFSSPDGQSIREDHPDVRGYVGSKYPRS